MNYNNLPNYVRGEPVQLMRLSPLPTQIIWGYPKKSKQIQIIEDKMIIDGKLLCFLKELTFKGHSSKPWNKYLVFIAKLELLRESPEWWALSFCLLWKADTQMPDMKEKLVSVKYILLRKSASMWKYDPYNAAKFSKI